MGQLTVATFNTHWGVHRGRSFDVVRPALALEADVLVLEEVWRPNGGPCFVDPIAAGMGASVHEAVFMTDHHPARLRQLHPTPGRPGTCGISVLSRLPVERVVEIELPHAWGDDVQHRRSLLVTVTVGDQHVTVGGMHASHRLWGSLPQVRRVDQALNRHGGPSVIAGDLNMWGPVVGLAVPHRSRAVIGRTWPARHPHSQIDHLWIDGGLRALDGGVAPATESDHRPIWARLEVVPTA
ncbi:MAG TPA: endonuclease/exonuclease/phosphatase family protein [Acidimicrobiia bacterium]|jgi:endonuclease/exonuclease/phosphatase (EEP) superfamily protein YafD